MKHALLIVATKAAAQDLFLGKADNIYDFTFFETTLIPAWLSHFAIDLEVGNFSYYANSDEPDLFGTIDVAHVLGSIGQLDNFTEARRDAWKTTIDLYQTWPNGFYASPSFKSTKLTSVHWSAGEATAALALLQRKPAMNNSNYTALASAGPAAWREFFGPLVSPDGPCPHHGLSNDIHSCGKIVGAVASVLAYTTGLEYRDFFEWWLQFVADNTNTTNGLVCPVSDSEDAFFECLGGGMAIHGIQLGLGLGFTSELSNPKELLEFSLSMQSEDGRFNGADGSMTLDGIFQITRPAMQLGVLRSDPRVKKACQKLVKTQHPKFVDTDQVLKTWGESSHDLPNIVAAVAECAMHFPELVKTVRPWTCCARYV